jgi:DNA mismatch repair protein MutL
MTQRYPVVVLNIEMDPGEVDINVHPTKEEVRFEEEKKVAGLVHRAVALALREQNLMPTFQALPELPGLKPSPAADAQPNRTDRTDQSDRSDPARSSRFSGAFPSTARLVESENDPSLPFLFSPSGVEPFRPGSAAPLPGLRPPAGGQTKDLFPPRQLLDTPQSSPAQSSLVPRDQADKANQTDQTDPTDPSNAVPQNIELRTSNFEPAVPASPPCSGPPAEASPLDPPRGAALSLGEGPLPAVLGQLGRTYILAEWGEDLLLIDQHAAHERLVYKRLRERPASEIPVQPLLAPITFEVAAAERDALDAILPLLREMGLDVQREASSSACAVHALPADFDSLDVAALVRDILDDVGKQNGQPLGLDDLRDRLQIRMACHAAIRAGQSLHPREMQALIHEIAEARLSFTCPHGRPTMVLLRKDQLDRQFGRKQ